MRPAGDVRQALMQAMAAYPTGATLQELAGRACVGVQVARRTVDNMHRAGALAKAGVRPVPYRNRPVVVYVAVPVATSGLPGGAVVAPGVALASALRAWV